MAKALLDNNMQGEPAKVPNLPVEKNHHLTLK